MTYQIDRQSLSHSHQAIVEQAHRLRAAAIADAFRALGRFLARAFHLAGRSERAPALDKHA